MNLSDLVNRSNPPEPWAEGENIPWEEPGFSERMLKEHLNPEHDAASRRPELIDEQVRWLHEEILDSKPTRVLDLGCGPGLYAVRMANLGHEVTGVDISPASLKYARELAADTGASCQFIEGDFRSVELDGSFGLVMQIYSELNVFRRHQAREIVRRSAESLEPGGRLVFEVDTPEDTHNLGHTGPRWRTRKSGLFSDRPHLYMEESFWDEAQDLATTRYWIVDSQTAEVTRYAQSFAAYEADEYIEMLTAAGLSEVELISNYPGALPGDGNSERWMLVASAASASTR